jgi:hypothetical protein
MFRFITLFVDEMKSFVIMLQKLYSILFCKTKPWIFKEEKRKIYCNTVMLVFFQRFHASCQSESNWGPALERHWKNVEYFPAVNTNALTVDIDHSPLHTVSGM